MATLPLGLKPLFLTGANARIVFGGKIIGFAVNVSYTVATPTIAIETLGRYEVVSHEPVAYFVGGSMDVIHYTSLAYQNAQGAKVPSNTNSEGNRPHLWTNDQFNPSGILNSYTCDLIISQKFREATHPATSTGVSTPGTPSAGEEAFRVTDCRMTSRSSNLSKRDVWFERYMFDGILFVDEGDFNETGYSGDVDLTQG